MAETKEPDDAAEKRIRERTSAERFVSPTDVALILRLLDAARDGVALAAGPAEAVIETGRRLREAGARAERASVVAWLRDPSRCSEKYDDDEERADAIERGEHLDKEGGGDETRK